MALINKYKNDNKYNYKNNKNKNTSINDFLKVINLRLFMLIFALFILTNFLTERKQIRNYTNNKYNVGLVFNTEAKAAENEEEEEVTTTSGIINIKVNMELLKSRLSELSFYYHKFSFIHISKCAGASWIKELSGLLPFMMPQAQQGKEYVVAYQKVEFFKKIPSNDVKLMTSFKHPRAHIWSLWGECIFDKVWRGHEKVPYNSTLSYEYNFESWLNHFLYIIDNNNETTMQYSYRNNNTKNSTTTFVEFQTHDYKCYHPANYQSRHLTAPASVKDDEAHGVTKLPNNEYKFEPNIDEVRSVRDTELDWISISEFFHESKCLLYHRLYKSLSNITTTTTNTTNNITDEIYNNIIKTTPKMVFTVEEKMNTAIKDIPYYLNRYCRCDNPPPEEKAAAKTTTNNNQKKVEHVQHYSRGKRKTFLDLPQDLIRKMDWFIKIDTINYRESLIEFLLEIAKLEYELGRRVLCDTTILKWEDELSYIGLPDKLSNIYKWAQKINVNVNNNDTTTSST